MPMIVAGIFISLQLMKHVAVSPMHPIQKMLQGDKWHILNLYWHACVIAPVLEETMFRGTLFNHLRRRWNWLISAGLVAFIFAAIHPQGWTFIPALGSIAIVLAADREWRGSLLGIRSLRTRRIIFGAQSVRWWRGELRLARELARGHREQARGLNVEPDLLLHHIQRPLLDLFVDAADVFAEDADADQLHAAEEQARRRWSS